MKSIICPNCWSGWAHQYHKKKYLTPFVNISIDPDEYRKLLKQLPLDLHDISLMRYENGHPIVSLCGIRIDAIHDTSYEEFARKWHRRADRFDWNNYRIIWFSYNEPLPEGVTVINVERGWRNVMKIAQTEESLKLLC